MALSFNIAGPCIPGEHYMIPPERRLGHVMQLIEGRKYFTLQAGRQTGKTTSAKALVRHYNASNEIHAAMIDVQTAREQPDPAVAFPEILGRFAHGLRRDLPQIEWPEPTSFLGLPSSALVSYVQAVSAKSPRPLVLFVDEADGLVGQAMVSFLTQIRTGYIDRDKVPFPSSIVLIGQRQVRDFVIAADERQPLSWLGTTSPFNITAESATIVPFTEAEVAELLGQHTEATGQVFEAEALRKVQALSMGHPWLVNALAAQITDWDVRDRAVSITVIDVEAAKDTIILERRTHIDSLIARLREPRVRRTLDPMLAGSRTTEDTLDDDFDYVLGLGLIASRGGQYQIANPIYREVIPRALSHGQQMQIHTEPLWYVRVDGSLDMDKLLRAWQVFWRKDGHLAAEGFAYRESGPHLMLMAFLQRIVNGGGRIEREYALGKGALDLMISWGARGEERHALEVKLRRDTETEQEAFEQVARYLRSSGLSKGYLVLFDLRKGRAWEEKLTWVQTQFEGCAITIVGC